MNPAEALRRGWGLDAAVTPLGEGHINDTYLARIPGADAPTGTEPAAERAGRTKIPTKRGPGWRADQSSTFSYDVAGPQLPPAAEPSNEGTGKRVLQRINQRVFRDPQLLMENVALASAHLNRKRPGWTPALIPARDGRLWAELDGEVWRLWSHIDGRSLSRLASNAQAEAAGRAFGRTRRWLQDIEGLDQREVIPGFLQLRHYLAAYDAGPKAQPELAAFIETRRSLSDRFRQPNGYIHGDCKVDNLIFDTDDEVVAVLDLDTLMCGHWAWEFGDLVRSALDGTVRPARFAAVAKGYLAEADVQAAVDDLILAPRYLAFMLGLRFLTDHLQGDRYFKVRARGENRQRALAQFRLLQALETEESTLRDCAAEVLAERA